MKLNVAFAVGLLCLVTFLESNASAQSEDQIKPYVLVIFDISGSMDSATGQGPSSCGGEDTRIDHAKCAIQQVMDAYADIQFGMGRFRAGGSCDACVDGDAIDCSSCFGDPAGTCDANMDSPDRFQLLVPFVEDSNDFIREWVNFDCGTAGCSLDPANNPELRLPSVSSFTPLGGALRGARRFFQGNDTSIAGSDALTSIYGVGVDDPIGTDPLKDEFISEGQQCRPYIVILLTDGEETCEVFDAAGTDDTVGAAADLLVTPFGGNNYRIEMKPIGFGITPGNAEIEALAHAGGEPDVAGNQGLYANSEAELISAFNQIITDSILVEICDGEDNDCDGIVDEGFQLFCDVDGGVTTASLCVNPGDDCDGVDDNCVLGITDEVTNACGLCGVLPTEICNLSDDDCDGVVDEDGLGGGAGSLCAGCTPLGQEACNNVDEDCDGIVDEGITRECGTDLGVCTGGTETCVAGVFVGCDATGGATEICDGLDNDCNGIVDGFVEECVEIPGNGAPFDGICQPGFRSCPVVAEGTPNDFGACQGEIGPAEESCDLIDNDCDSGIDENTGGADCSSACGVGTTQCVAGILECDSELIPLDDELCNNIDDDCDGVIDENVPDPVPNTCDEGGTLCLPGVLQCIGGGFVCTGGVPPGIEVCDCEDNDCDGQIDEEPPALCPTGSSCTNCQCAFPCSTGEFPCPIGHLCSSDNFCLPDPCFGVDCSPDETGATTCVAGECVPVCSQVDCPDTTLCRPSDGTCQLDNCRGFPERCLENELCVLDECVADPCFGVDCPAEEEYCFVGACVGSCAGITCPDGQECSLGQCEIPPCGDTCQSGESCSEAGECQPDPCRSKNCGVGQVCDSLNGDCIADPCVGIECPGDQVCQDGSCFVRDSEEPEVDHEFVSPGGGGGCSTGGGSTQGLGFILIGLALALGRRREEQR